MLLRLARSLAARGWHRAAHAVLAVALSLRPSDAALFREQLAITSRSGNTQQLAIACKNLLAVCPNDAFALEALAVIQLTGGEVDAAQQTLASAHRHGELCGLRFARDSLIDPARAQSEGVYVATLHDVEIETADWSILDGDKVYNTEAHNRALRKGPMVQGRASPDNSAYIFRLPAVTQTIDVPCINLGGDHNFCHWITRNMVKLGLLEGTGYASLPLLINADLRRHQLEFLELLKIPTERLIKLERPALVKCRELIVPTNVTNHGKMGIGTQWLRRQLAHCMDTAPPRERLFVSRRDANTRRLLNEAELEAALAPFGFVSILPGEMPVREQILRFSRAEIIVGAHGAAFGNLVFATPGTRVLEINSTCKAHIFDFDFIARICKLDLVKVISDDYDFSRPEPYQADTDFRVDVEEVLAMLRRIAPEIAV